MHSWTWHSFTPPGWKSLWCPLDRRLGGSENFSWSGGEERNLCSCRELNPVHPAGSLAENSCKIWVSHCIGNEDCFLLVCVTPFSLADRHRRFRRTWFLHLQCRISGEVRKVRVTMQATRPFITLPLIYQTTWRHIPEYSNVLFKSWRGGTWNINRWYVRRGSVTIQFVQELLRSLTDAIRYLLLFTK
jgi:hypothetical protein